MKTIFSFFLLIIAMTLSLTAQGITIGASTIFSLGGSTLSLPNDWSNAGTFNTGTGTVIFNGSGGNQTIANASGEVFQNLSVNKPAGEIILINNIAVNSNLALINGDINLNGLNITLGASAMLSETAGNTVKGANGVITTTRTLGANPGNVAGLGVNISISPALGSTTIERGHRPDTIGTSNSITRNYKITPTNNSGLNATASFYYDTSELNNLTEANLGLFKSTDNGVKWSSVGGTLNTTNNYITASAIASFSKWSLFSTANPPTSVEEEGAGVIDIPKAYALSQNFPNPFNPTTSISFDIPKQSDVLIKIFDVIGREVTTIVNENLAAGRYTKTWNASSFPSGVYFYKIDARQIGNGQGSMFTTTKKLLLIK